MLNSHISAIYLQKYKKYSEKCFYGWILFAGELDLTLFYKIEGYFEKPKSLMTLMTLTLMTGLMNTCTHNYLKKSYLFNRKF